MSRAILTLSLLFNAGLLAGVAYLLAYDPAVATVSTPSGATRTVLASELNAELADRHAEDLQGDLVGRTLIELAISESQLFLDEQEFQARWQDWLAEPGTRARLDTAEVTEAELRERLTTLVLLDQLSWNELTPREQDTAMKEAFEANQRAFEQLNLRHIVVENPKDANDLAGRLAAGVAFEDLARRFSLDPLTREQGGEMGWKRRADLTEELRAFLFLLPTGTASPPIASPSGWHIFLVEERRETFDDCKQLVRRELMRQMRPETLDALRQRYEVQRSPADELKQKLRRPGFFRSSNERRLAKPASSAPPPHPPRPLPEEATTPVANSPTPSVESSPSSEPIGSDDAPRSPSPTP